MNIFDFSDYKAFVKERLKEFPRGGRGQLKAMASALRLQLSSLSLVFSVDRELSPEQACGVSSFLQLNEVETEHFLTIVELAKAFSRDEHGLKPLILRTVLRQNDQTSFMYYKGWRQVAVNRYHSSSLLEPHECGDSSEFHTTKDVMLKIREMMGYINLDLHGLTRGPS